MKHKINHLHFVGIGGTGMSGIAEVLLSLGYKVSGSDISESDSVARLRTLGATITLGHDAANIEGADVLVVSSAVNSDNPEVKAARISQIAIVPRAVMLAELMRFKRGIAIAGAHGKTTTTSLIAHVLNTAGLDPTCIIGGRLNAIGTNARLGQGEFLVAEADESDASFLYLQPVMAVVTNIDEDHMATYDHDFAKLQSAFVEFLEHLPFYGLCVLCIDDVNVRNILSRLTKPVLTYGFSPAANLRAINVRADGAQMRFDAVDKETTLSCVLNLAGEHNVRNALAVIAIAREAGCEDAAITAALGSFGGVGRRFQRYDDIVVAEVGRATLIDDYGHHPAEMSAVLAAARGAFPERRVLLAFQPHRYSRTRDLFQEFVSVLCTADEVVLAEVYPAGEARIEGADSAHLAVAMRAAAGRAPIVVATASDLPDAIRRQVRDGDVVITMGAGSIGSVAASLARTSSDAMRALAEA